MDLPLHGAAVVNWLGSLEPRSPRDKGNREFEFLATWLVQPGHVTPNTALWLAQLNPRTAAMFKSTIAGMRPAWASTPMFLSRALTISALFLNIKPWKLTEIQDVYNRNISTNIGSLLVTHKFRRMEENHLEKFLPFSRQCGRLQSKMATRVCSTDKSLWTDETDGHLKFVAAGKKDFFHVRSVGTLNYSWNIFSTVFIWEKRFW